MENAVFSKLKYGDKLVSIDAQGEVKYYTYLCRDPNNKDKWAFLACQDDSTIRPYYAFIEKMFLHECYEKTKAYAEQIRADYYSQWLIEHAKTKDERSEEEWGRCGECKSFKPFRENFDFEKESHRETNGLCKHFNDVVKCIASCSHCIKT